MGTTPSRITTTSTTLPNLETLNEENKELEAQIAASEKKKNELLISDAINKARINELNKQNEEAEINREKTEKNMEVYEQLLKNQSESDAKKRQERIDAANAIIKARREAVLKAREEANKLRNSDDNKCVDNVEQILAKIKKKEEELKKAQEKEEEAKVAEKKVETPIQPVGDAEMKKRAELASRGMVSINFQDRDNQNVNQMLPILVQPNENDDLTDVADTTINNIFTNHYNRNLRTYMHNKIKINEMKKNIDNLNSNLHRKMNKNITYGTDGEMRFY